MNCMQSSSTTLVFKNIVDSPHFTCGDIEDTYHFLFVCHQFTGLLNSGSDICQPNLTHLCRMYFLILINWKSPFPILGFFGGNFHFYLISKRHFCFAASGLVLHCFPMSHKEDARLIWVKIILCGDISLYVTRHDILCPNAVKRDVGKTRCKSDVI